MVSTENILFIIGGSFERTHNNLESIVKKRLQHKGRVNDDGSVEIKGFAAEEKKNGNGRLLNYYKKAESDDFIKFGLLPELIGRSPIKTFVNMLSKNDLIRIMQETEDSILNQYKKEYGIELILDNDVQNYLENYAHDNNITISFVLKKLLSGASALNYMGIKEPFKITQDMVQDEKYFDKLFSHWYENQKEKNIVKN